MQVACISSGPSEEVFSFSFGGADANFIAAGCNSQVLLIDANLISVFVMLMSL